MEVHKGDDSLCKQIPAMLSSFVDTFVDFSVSGLFLLPDPNPHSHSTPLQTRYPAADRLIAVGDVHGDFEKTRQSLRLAGLVDESDKWIGGSTMVVQIGDVLDRGDNEIKILYYIEKLKREAARSGGTIISMNGNHEIMNVEGDFRFVTKKGVKEFENWAEWYRVGNQMKTLCENLENPEDPFEGIPMGFRKVRKEYCDGFRARIAALRPSGPISARFLSQNVTVVVVGESVFVHGGLLPEHVAKPGLEEMNEEVRNWINGWKGKEAPSPSYCRSRDAVVWLRRFSHEAAEMCDCSTLEHVLATIPGAKRMIMGHTIQQTGINGACEGRAIRIDVGMSKGCINGQPEVLEIIHGNSEPRILGGNSGEYKSVVANQRRRGLGLVLPDQHGPNRQVRVKA
ncbi:shewanella-like protein phosphatase 2 [Humulus lupulus]|uniref:shewanella-like protein phosphatase 2 n=1 Tax=Humulus lupulus TaxID=3486 RepID=UPI002B40EA75|nr:shewanella-like protein phosphatase 2 [Humulus lupulus]